MALHSRYAVTVFAAVATRSRADCSSMEDRRRKSLISVNIDVGSLELTGGMISPTVNDRHHERGNKRPYQPKHSPSIEWYPFILHSLPDRPAQPCSDFYTLVYLYLTASYVQASEFQRTA